MARVGRTIAFPSAYVWALGAALVLVGAGVPAWWAYLRTRAYAPAELDVTAVGDGPLRPAMVLLPATPDGSRLAISERPVTFGEFIRIVGEISIDARCSNRRLTNDDLEKPVVCLSTPREARHYANLLTDEENQARSVTGGTWLKPCYKAPDMDDVDVSCTGYRLPTIAEWGYAATLHSVALKIGSSKKAQPAPIPGPEEKACQSAAWFIFGMCGAPELAVAPGLERSLVAMKVDRNDVVASPYDGERPATLRIVRTVSESDSF